jgi:membrane associated rhomboid family serine protease
MRKSPTIPYATLSLALLITIIQVMRSIGGSYNELVFANLIVVSWELLYNQPWRILTSPFIHHNLLHYFENLFFSCCLGGKLSAHTDGLFS